MKNEPVGIILGVFGAILAGLEFVPLPGPWPQIIKFGSLAVGAALARQMVTPTAKLPAAAAPVANPPGASQR
jgi:hypothetical protein